MFSLPCGCLFLAALLTADKAAAAHPVLDQLAAEAETQQAVAPARWKQYGERAARVFTENEWVAAHWRKRTAPPRPDLLPLRLPLAFLVEALRKNEGSKAVSPGRPPRDAAASRRHAAYLAAVVHSADERRIPALVEYRDHYRHLRPADKYRHPWGRLIAEAATRKWAAARIAELAGRPPASTPTWRGDDLLYCLADRFARDLPADLARLAYDRVRGEARDRLTGYDEEQLWDILFRLDTARARRDILPFFARAEGFLHYNTHVPGLLFRYAGPAPEVAAAVRRWLADTADLTDFSRRQLLVVRLRSDPAHELGPALKLIDQRLAEQKRKAARFEFGGDVHWLLLALGDVRTRSADDAAARYVFERAIDVGVRSLVLEALVKHRYPKAPELIRRWLAEEPEYTHRAFEHVQSP